MRFFKTKLVVLLFGILVVAFSKALPSLCPSNPDIIGYSDWFTLRNDIQTNAYGYGVSYIICPGSSLNVGNMTDPRWEEEHWIYINGNNTINSTLTIQCGPDGGENNNCIIDGGTSHFTIEDGANVKLRGLTMKNSDGASVYVSSLAEVLFEDCIWTENRNIEEECNRGCTAAVFGFDSNLSFSGCRFMSNSASFGALHVLYGALQVDKSLFVRNRSTKLAVLYGGSTSHSTGSAITAHGTIVSKISNSCFLENISAGAGTVKVDEVSEDGDVLEVNDNNFFENNIVEEDLGSDIDSCTAIVKHSNTDWTLNECIDYSGDSCTIAPCGFSDDAWAFDCGTYEDPCRKFDFASCEECTGNGCMWCGSDSICSSEPFNMSFFESFNETSSCDVTDYVSTCEETTNVFGDPLYDAQEWVYKLINIENVWRSGITGDGVHIRINDEGVDAFHPDISSKFDRGASCQIYLPQGSSNDHGTTCAAIASASAGDDTCSVGVAPDSMLSSCRILGDGDETPEWDDASYLSIHLDKMDISSNSWGFNTCDNLYGRRRLDATCPFLPDAERSPCSAPECSDIDWSSPQPSEECELAITKYCFYEYENDVSACIEFLDIFVDCSYNSLSDAEQKELTRGITEGRGGKGVIYVFASGNDFDVGGDTNFQGATNSRFVISVGAVGKSGNHSSYSNPGASLFISGPGGDFEFIRNHVVAKPGGRCHDAGVGTSYSTPVVSGVIALMLQVNPELGWRDVQGILASTSQKTDPDDSSWSTNAAGFHHSYKYGFGLVDAEAAVSKAKVWENFSTEKPLIVESGIIDMTISDNSSDEVISTVAIKTNTLDKFIVESSVVYLDLSHASRGDLEVVLTSPSGTESVLHPGKRPENTLLKEEERWKLTTVRAWGEVATGNWTLSIVDKSEGDHDECVDDPSWYFPVELDDESFNASCVALVRSGLCENGTFLGDEDYPNPSDLASPDGALPTEGCCDCGGGIVASTIVDKLKSWRLVVYSHIPPKKEVQESIVVSLINVPDREMDANENLIFEQSIVEFMNKSDATNDFDISDMTVEVSEQLVALFIDTSDSGQQTRNRLFRGLENTDDNTPVFYNQISVSVTGRCHDCESAALTSLFHDAVDADPQGLIESLEESSSTSSDYFTDIDNITISNFVVQPQPLTLQPTTSTIQPTTIQPVMPAMPTPRPTASSSNDVPSWFWIVVIVGVIAALLLAVLLYALLRHRSKVTSAAAAAAALPTSSTPTPTSSTSDIPNQKEQVNGLSGTENTDRTDLTITANAFHEPRRKGNDFEQPVRPIPPPIPTTTISIDDVLQESRMSSTIADVGSRNIEGTARTNSFAPQRQDDGLDQPITRRATAPPPSSVAAIENGDSDNIFGRPRQDAGLEQPMKQSRIAEQPIMPPPLMPPPMAASHDAGSEPIMTTADDGAWTCNMCTYKNDNPDHLSCEMCRAPRIGMVVN